MANGGRKQEQTILENNRTLQRNSVVSFKKVWGMLVKPIWIPNPCEKIANHLNTSTPQPMVLYFPPPW